MFTKTENTKTFTPVRTATHAVLVAVFLAAPFAAPSTAQAGPIDKIKTRVEQTHKNVRAIRGRVNAVYGDLQEKRQMLGAESKEQLVEAIRTTLEYMQHARADYAGFVGPDNCGTASDCGAFRGQIQDMIKDFIALPAELPFVENVPPVVNRLQKISNLVNHMPPPVLFVTEKAAGAPLENIKEQIETVRAIAAAMPPIPTIREINEMNKQTAKQVCTTVIDNPHIDLMQVALNNLSSNMSDVAGLLPETLDVTVAAFGTNIKFPPKLVLQVFSLVVKSVERKLKLRLAFVKSSCAVMGFPAK